MSIIRTERLAAGYSHKSVVSDIDLNISDGELACLIGANGSGKSTVLKTIAGLLPAVSGRIYLDGEDLTRIKRKKIAKSIAVVLTDNIFPTTMTAYELVSMGRIPFTDFFGVIGSEDKKIIDEAFEQTGAEGLKGRVLNELSDGERQKIMIARAIVQQPRLLILDEPISHLDINHKIEVIRILRRLASEKQLAVIMSLHDIELAMKASSTVHIISDGRITASGAPEDIIEKEEIHSTYGIENADFNELFGSVEICGEKGRTVFVIGGGGTGIKVYRALSRMGFTIYSGVLHENDCDFQVASALCDEISAEKPFEEIGSEAYARARTLAEKSELIIDTGFPVGRTNMQNIHLLADMLDMGKKIYSLRRKTEYRSLLAENADRLIMLENISEIAVKLNNK